MIGLMLLAAAAGFQAQAVPVPAPSPAPVGDAAVAARMASLYDDLCLHKFPDDAALGAAAVAAGGVAMTPAQVRIYLHDDPGMGWAIADGPHQFIVTIEHPPYPACTVRRWTPAGIADLSAYRAAADAFEAGHPGFAPMQPADFDVHGVASHVTGEVAQMADHAETLLVFSNDPATENADPAGPRGIEVRFVHQIVMPQGPKT